MLLGNETTDRGRVASRPGGGFAGCLLRAVLEESVPQEVPRGRAAADQLVQAVVVLLVAGKLSVACFPHMLQAQVYWAVQAGLLTPSNFTWHR